MSEPVSHQASAQPQLLVGLWEGTGKGIGGKRLASEELGRAQALGFSCPPRLLSPADRCPLPPPLTGPVWSPQLWNDEVDKVSGCWGAWRRGLRRAGSGSPGTAAAPGLRCVSRSGSAPPHPLGHCEGVISLCGETTSTVGRPPPPKATVGWIFP